LGLVLRGGSDISAAARTATTTSSAIIWAGFGVGGRSGSVGARSTLSARTTVSVGGGDGDALCCGILGREMDKAALGAIAASATEKLAANLIALLRRRSRSGIWVNLVFVSALVCKAADTSLEITADLLLLLGGSCMRIDFVLISALLTKAAPSLLEVAADFVRAREGFHFLSRCNMLEAAPITKPTSAVLLEVVADATRILCH
jgi:hypothetical protein